MAKGQNRSNREFRKPKQKKEPAKPANTFGNRAHLTVNATQYKGKK